MKNKFLIAVDLDDTLVKNFDKYDRKSFELLKELSKSHYVVIATGRPYRSSKYYYDLLGLNTPIINYNGALVHHPKDEKFKKFKITIDKNIVFDLIKDNEDILVNLFCEIEDNIFLWKNTKETVPYLHLDGGYLTIGDLEQTLHSNPNGAIVLTKPGSEEKLNNYIKSKYNGKVNIRFWHVDDVVVSEIYSPLTSKGNGLKLVTNYYNIPLENTIAIGDGHNDIEMIEFANYGVAMKNAHQELLKRAKHITDTVDENGVYNFLNNFFNKI